MLIGLEFLAIRFNYNFVLEGVIAVFVVLLARLISVGIPISLMKLKRNFIPNTITVMTWGGLRGGISVALALTLTSEMYRELFVSMTYIVVIFSILFQGLTIGILVKKVNASLDETEINPKAPLH